MHSDKDASKRHAPSKGICSVVAALWPNKLLSTFRRDSRGNGAHSGARPSRRSLA